MNFADLNLTSLSDDELAELKQKVEEEEYRRYELGTAASRIVEIIRSHASVGGDASTLASEIEDELAASDT